MEDNRVIYKNVEKWFFNDDVFAHMEKCLGAWDTIEEYNAAIYKIKDIALGKDKPSVFIIMPEDSYEQFINKRDLDMPDEIHISEVQSHIAMIDVIKKYPELSLELKLVDKHPADKYFMKSLHDILDNGISTESLPCSDVRTKWKDGTPAHYVYVTNKVYEYDLSEGYFPLISYRPQAWKLAIKEILWIYRDQTNDLSVLKNNHNIHWWDQHESKDMPGTIGQRYGATIKRYDLINKLLESLSTKGSNRRLVVDMLQYTDLNESDGLYPCAYSTTWNVRGEYLDMILNQRSSDFLMAWSINQAQYAALLVMIAKAAGLKPGKFTHVIGNLHIYDRHLEAAKILLERTVDSNKAPKISFNPSNENDFYSFELKDFILEDYEPNPEQLKLEIAI